MIPDAEKTVGKWLRSRQAVRVVSEPPPETNRATAWVQILQLDAPDDPLSGADYLITPLLQLDCYAGETGGVPEAIALGRAVRAELKALEGQVHESVQVGRVQILGHTRLPDTSEEPARQRVILTASLVMHEVAEGS